MPDFLLPLLPEYSIDVPNDPAAWIGWGIWLVSLLAVLFKVRGTQKGVNPQQLPLLALFSVMVLFLTPFMGFLPSAVNTGQEGIAPIQHFMVLAALPWMFAGGMLGIVPGVFVGGMSGLLLSYLDTHNVFTPLIFMTCAVIFGYLERQRYRGKVYQWLRFPLVAAGASLLILLPLVFCSVLLSIDGSPALRIGQAYELILPIVISLSGMILIGGVISSVLWIFTRQSWIGNKSLQPSPGEKSLKFQWLVTAGPILTWMLIVIFSASWGMNEQNARRLKVQQLTDTVNLIADSLPGVIYSSENMLLSFAEEISPHSSSPEMVESIFASSDERLPSFDQLTLLDPEGVPLISSPGESDGNPDPDDFDMQAIQNAFMGDTLSVITTTPDLENQVVFLNFFVKIVDPAGLSNQVLWGKVNFGISSNYFAVFNILSDFGQAGCQVQIIGRDGSILYHTDLSQIGEAYVGTVPPTPTYTEVVSQAGQEMLTYFLPIQDLGWGLSLSIPVQVVYEIAWTQTIPVLILGSGSLLVSMLIGLFGLNPLIKTVNRMKRAAAQVLNGHDPQEDNLYKPVGELGQFHAVFNTLLKAQHKQRGTLNHNAEIGGAAIDPTDLQRTLESLMSQALTRGVSSVRVVLSRPSAADGAISQDRRFGSGEYTQLFAHNDDVIARRTFQEGLFVLNNTPLEQTLHITKGELIPNMLVASPLTWRDQWLGAVWLTYQDMPSSGHEEIAFIKTLAERLSRAVVAAQSLEDSKALSYQLEALLKHMPEAVLITDAAGIVLFENKAALNLFSKDKKPLRGTKLDTLLPRDAAKFIEKGQTSPMTEEIRFPGDKIYRIFMDQLTLYKGYTGLGIIFRDITQDKLNESLKTEFVATVSHELRSPLTIVHGYAKILRLTGNLNEQQDATMRKIIDGIEEMKHLVQNLLDISRLEDETTLEFEQINAVHLAKEVMKSLEAQSRQKNIQVKFSSSDSPIYIQANSTYLRQALKNLLDNAIKFTNLGGKVSVNVRTQDQHVIYSVQDNGIGVAPLDQHRLFDKFQRINPPSGIDSEGSGLGLAIVSSVAERHRGKVWVESRLGEGSTFYLKIPTSQVL